MKKLFTLLAVTLMGAHLAGAQSIVTGDISGHVVDITGASVVGATVSLTSVAQGTTSTVQTDKTGSYRFSLLRPGTYTINEHGLNLSAKAVNVQVNVGQITPVELVARPGETQVVVEISAAEPLLETDNANVATTFSMEQMQELPLAGADISMVALTAPGVVMNTGGGLSSNFFVFGMPGTSNLFTINGADIMDPFYNINNSGASNNTLGANEIQEVAVVAPGYSGVYGRLPGAQVNFTTKSGANKFHGSAKYQYNGSFMNARDWFTAPSTPRSKNISNQYGVDISGPIIKNKLFVYFDDEGLRYVAAAVSAQTFIPTTAFANATLANISATQPAELAYYKQIFALYAGANGAAGAVADTPANPNGDPQNGCADLTLAGFGAGAQSCSATLNSANASLNTEQFYAVRVDQNIGSKDTAFYRYKHDFGIQATATDPINPVFSANSVQPEWDGQFGERHLFSPNIVNNFTAAGSYYKAIFGPPSIGAALAVFPTTIAVTSFTQLGGSDNAYPSGRDVAQYQFVDDLTYTRGRSTYKAGLNFRRNNFSNFANQPGTSGLTNLASLTDFYKGTINTLTSTSPPSGTGQIGGSSIAYSFPTSGPIEAKFYSLGFYVEDQIKASSELQLTASLRFDRNSNPQCRHACFTRLVGPFSTIAKGAAVPYNQSIITGNYNPYPSVQAISVEPRFGFAYTPRALKSTTVFRGGVGMFADSPILALTSRFLTAAPSDPAFTLQNAGTYPIFAQAPNSAYSTLKASNAAFQTGFAAGYNLTQIQAAVAPAPFNAPSYTASVNNELKNPKYLEYNLDVQHSFGSADVVDLQYNGNFGIDIFFQNSTGNAYAVKGDNFGGLSNTKPDPRFTYVTNLTNDAHSNYNGLSAGYRHQAKYGLTTSINYTYSKALGNTSNGGLYGASTGVEGDPIQQTDPFSLHRLDYGPLDYDFRHSVNMNYLWKVPSYSQNSLVKKITGGFVISGVVFAKTGAPFTVYNSSAKTAEVSTSSNGVVLAALLPGQKQGSCNNPSSVCLTKANFATTAGQAAYGFGNIAKNSFRGPRFFDTDLSIEKNISVFEKYKLKIGATAYNVLNHQNFAPPTNSVTSGTFGTIHATVASSPSSLYGNGQGSSHAGRVLALTAGFNF
jgi:hypothetical protein